MAYLFLKVELQDDVWKSLNKEQQVAWVDAIVSECNSEGYVSSVSLEVS